MKKQLLLSAMCIVLLAVCLSCENMADENTIFIDKEILVFPPEGGTQTFYVTCSMEWEIVTQVFQYADITITPQKGCGNQEITVTMGPNILPIAEVKRIAVRAGNGITKNVIVRQETTEDSSGLLIAKPNFTYLGGKAGSEVEILVASLSSTNIWKMTGGAEWLEVSVDDGLWESSTKDIFSAYKPAVHLKFRSVSKNDDKYDRDAVFSIQDFEEEPIELKITQLGRYRASPQNLTYSANSIAMDWLYGCDTKKVSVTYSKEDVPFNELSGWYVFDPVETIMPIVTYNMDEDTEYYLYWVSSDGVNSTGAKRQVATLNSKNQPEITIVPIGYKNGYWEWTTTKNALTDYFYMWVTDDQSLFDWNDAALAWFIRTHQYDIKKNYQSSSTHKKEGIGPYMVVTWGFDMYGLASTVVNRQILQSKNNK